MRVRLARACRRLPQPPIDIEKLHHWKTVAAPHETRIEHFAGPGVLGGWRPLMVASRQSAGDVCFRPMADHVDDGVAARDGCFSRDEFRPSRCCAAPNRHVLRTACVRADVHTASLADAGGRRCVDARKRCGEARRKRWGCSGIRSRWARQMTAGYMRSEGNGMSTLRLQEVLWCSPIPIVGIWLNGGTQ